MEMMVDKVIVQCQMYKQDFLTIEWEDGMGLVARMNRGDNEEHEVVMNLTTLNTMVADLTRFQKEVKEAELNKILTGGSE